MTSDSQESTPKRSNKRRSVSHSPERIKKSKYEHKSKRKSRASSSGETKNEGKGRKEEKKNRDYMESEQPYKRYYGDDIDRKKKNSDRYWNKYAKDEEEPVVGNRYYDDKKEEKKKKGGETPAVKPRVRKQIDMLTSRTGGAYIPPAKLRMMQAEITDKSSAAYQRIAWEALKKSIHGYINKVNTSNIAIIAKELLHENIVRGRGLLCKSIIQAQAASPTFTNVYSALVAIINSKFPNIGELLLKRLVLQFKRGFKQNNKTICISAATFIAHLVNQGVAHEILALEILTLLVETPTDDSVEVAISFLKECGQKLTEVSSKGINAIFEMLRNILHEGQLEKRIQYMIEVMFQIRKDGFKDHEAVIEELDLVDEEDQFIHLVTLDDVIQSNSEDILNVFKFDEKYEENEGKYKLLSKEILDDGDTESGSGSEDAEDEEEEDDQEGNEEDDKKEVIIDNTDTNLITLRRTIYLTMQSSLDFEECTHKLLKMQLKPGQEIELCHMILDCCAEQRTYEKFFGLVAQRFCQINKVYVGPFQQIFKDTYATTHRLDANRLRNVSKFFAHLLFTDAIGWEALEIMKLNEEDTNSSSRIFIKILFQELAEYMGLSKLNIRLKEESMQAHFSGLFPKDHPKNTRFSINFFTSIGLGGLTDELREHLKIAPKVPQITLSNNIETSSSSSSSTSSSSESSSDDEKQTTSGSSTEEEKSRRKETNNKYKRRGHGEYDSNSDKSSDHEKHKTDRHNVRNKEKEYSEMKGKKISRRIMEEDSSRGRDKQSRIHGRAKWNESKKSVKDYELIKSRPEDGNRQLKSQKEYFQKSGKKEERSKRHKIEERRDDRRENNKIKREKEGQQRKDEERI